MRNISASPPLEDHPKTDGNPRKGASQARPVGEV